MLNNPQDSVCDYLAELLYEEEPAKDAMVPEPAPKPIAPAPQVKPKLAPVDSADASENFAPPVDKARLERLLSSAQAARREVEIAPVAAPVVVEAPTPVTKVAPEAIPVVQEALPEPEPVRDFSPWFEWAENGRPQWAQERFDVLLFKVYGLTLAVPLIALGQIQPLTDELTPLFGQAEWFMGIQPTPMGKIKTVNTALFVMPERYNPAFLDSARYVISIDGLDWGLAVDSVEQPKSLSPDDVKWRSSRGQRAWLAGTVKAHMCALIDIPNMGRLLTTADRNTKGATRRR